MGEFGCFLRMQIQRRYRDGSTVGPYCRFGIEIYQHWGLSLELCFRPKSKGVLDQLNSVQMLESLLAIGESIAHVLIGTHLFSPNLPPVGS